MITGNLKKHFDRWLIANKYNIPVKTFHKLVPALQFGVYQDFFWKTYGIDMYILPKESLFRSLEFEVYLCGICIYDAKTYDEAREIAVKEASKHPEKRFNLILGV